MTRLGKKEERRGRCPRKRKGPSEKTGSKKDNLPRGFKEHENAATVEQVFIPKIR